MEGERGRGGKGWWEGGGEREEGMEGGRGRGRMDSQERRENNMGNNQIKNQTHFK